jgi:hypothetical protein
MGETAMTLAEFRDDYVMVRHRRPRAYENLCPITEPVMIIDIENSTKVPPAAPANWMNEVIARVQDLSTLEKNWDGRGSAAVKAEVLYFAVLNVLAASAAPSTVAPSMIPLGNGGIQMVWSNEDAELEVEVAAPLEVIVYFHNRRTNEEREFSTGADFSELGRILKERFTR